MRSKLLLQLVFVAPTVALADPPVAVTPSCTQFGTETGYMCAFTRRVNLTWVCGQYGFSSGACVNAYVDCEVKLVWWESEDFDAVEPSVTCGAVTWGT